MRLPGFSSLEYQIVTVRQSRLGLLLLVLAAVSAVAAIALLWGAQDNYPRIAGAGLCALLSWRLAKAGKQRRIPVLRSPEALRHLAERTGIPVVLYLRRFADDMREDHPQAEESSLSDSDEAELASAFQKHCLFVAVGRPGEPLPPWGAYRLYLDDEQWEARVRELISFASLLLVRWGDSEPLQKEFELIKQASKLDRTLFLLPPAKTPAQLRHSLPAGTEFDVDVAEQPGSKQYGAFFTLAADGGRIHYRDLKTEYGEAASQVAVDCFAIGELSDEQRHTLRGFYGAFEQVLERLLMLGFYTLAGSLGGLMLVILVLFGSLKLLEAVKTSAILDGIVLVCEGLLTGLGWTLLVSLGFVGIMIVLLNRLVP